jgi:nicotinamidase/pyrazinamidase
MERGIEEVYICGLARDVCVKWTAEDAADAGFRTFLIWDLSRAVDPSSDQTVRTSLEARGVQIVLSADLRDA